MFDTAGRRSAPFVQSLSTSRRQARDGSAELTRAVEFQPDFDFSIAVVNGTSMMPWLSSVLIQAAIRSIEIGSAEATPTAVPRPRPTLPGLAGARLISPAGGTASIEISAFANGIAWPPASVAATLR